MTCYLIYDKNRIFGPFATEESADEFSWNLYNENRYDGVSSEVIDAEEYAKRFPNGGAITPEHFNACRNNLGLKNGS